jgi:hypothetical protein
VSRQRRAAIREYLAQGDTRADASEYFDLPLSTIKEIEQEARA